VSKRHHVVIRRPEFVFGGKDRPEVAVFTQTHQTRHPSPWGKIAHGDQVWMKWSGGPIVAKATVSGFRQFEKASPHDLRLAVSGSRLGELDRYWECLPPRFHAVSIWLENESWVDPPKETLGRSFGESWLVLNNDADFERWIGSPPSAPAPTANKPKRPSRTLSHSIRFHILRRDSFTCRYCGGKSPDVKLHVDHFTPWSKGGSNDAANLVTACETCNLGKGAQGISE